MSRSTLHPRRAPVGRIAVGAASLTILLLAAAMPAASAAGFDCGKATSAVEKRICADPILSGLDGRLAEAYRAALAATDDYGRKALGTEQRDWVAHARNICEDDFCLRQAYTDRIAVLSRNEKHIIDRTEGVTLGSDGNRSVVHYRNPNARIGSFNKSLAAAKTPGTILGCSALIDLPVGTASGNDSFGGLCTLAADGKRSEVQICDDDMVGHFAMQPADPARRTDAALIEFTNANCYGG